MPYPMRNRIAQAFMARQGGGPPAPAAAAAPASAPAGPFTGVLAPVANTVHNAFQQGPVGQMMNSPVMQPYFNEIRRGFEQGPVGQVMNAPVMQPYLNAIRSGFQNSPASQLLSVSPGSGSGKSSAVMPPAPTP